MNISVMKVAFGIYVRANTLSKREITEQDGFRGGGGTGLDL